MESHHMPFISLDCNCNVTSLKFIDVPDIIIQCMQALEHAWTICRYSMIFVHVHHSGCGLLPPGTADGAPCRSLDSFMHFAARDASFLSISFISYIFFLRCAFLCPLGRTRLSFRATVSCKQGRGPTLGWVRCHIISRSFWSSLCVPWKV